MSFEFNKTAVDAIMTDMFAKEQLTDQELLQSRLWAEYDAAILDGYTPEEAAAHVEEITMVVSGSDL